MQNLFYTLEQYKNQARLLHKNMKEMKITCSYMQAMQLTAKSHGYHNWETLEKNVLKDGLCFQIASSNELTLDVQKSNNLWVTVNNISVCVKANDEGVSVDLYSLDQEDSQSIASTYAFYSEAENYEDELSQIEAKFDNLRHAQDIKENLLSNNPDSYNNQEYAIDCLVEECFPMFKNRKDAYDFLLSSYFSNMQKEDKKFDHSISNLPVANSENIKPTLAETIKRTIQGDYGSTEVPPNQIW